VVDRPVASRFASEIVCTACRCDCGHAFIACGDEVLEPLPARVTIPVDFVPSKPALRRKPRRRR
jgi:hypothetical protein